MESIASKENYMGQNLSDDKLKSDTQKIWVEINNDGQKEMYWYFKGEPEKLWNFLENKSYKNK